MAAPRMRAEAPHSRFGGCRGYGPEMREQVLLLANAGHTQHLIPSNRTIRRWRATQTVGTRRELNRRRPQRIVGTELLLVAVFRLAWPKACADDVSAFLFEQTGNLYARYHITRAEQRLGLKRKVASTTAHQALTPFNLFRRQQFWTAPFPLGVVGTPRASLWDMDECALYLELANPTHGKAYSGLRVRSPGVYGRSQKWTLILAVDCAGNTVVELQQVAGTTTDVFTRFVDRVVARSALVSPGVQRTLMFDNLSSHLGARVYNAVTFAGHRVLPRAAYRPEDGPIEFVFNTLEGEIRKRWAHIANADDFVRETHAAIANMARAGFDNYFVHCGFA